MLKKLLFGKAGQSPVETVLAPGDLISIRPIPDKGVGLCIHRETTSSDDETGFVFLPILFEMDDGSTNAYLKAEESLALHIANALVVGAGLDLQRSGENRFVIVDGTMRSMQPKMRLVGNPRLS